MASRRSKPQTTTQDNIELKSSVSPPAAAHTKHHHILPTHNHNGHKVTKHIKPEGESGRRGIHPLHFFRITWRSASDASRIVNILWPVVPPAIAIRYAKHDMHLAIFILNYIAMVPCANLIGFAGQELARKLPKVFGVLVETTLGSVVEIVLFMVLLTKDQFLVIQAAILGSILATQLLCLGMCFFAGGLKRDEQEFDEAVSEVGSGLLLTAGLGLIIPAVFYQGVNQLHYITEGELKAKTVDVSRITSIFLICAYFVYIWFQMRTHHGIYDAILEQDELNDDDRHRDLKKDKLTLTECIIALTISIALVTIIAINLVEQIPHIVEERHISDLFMGLILVPLVEKFAEHLTAIDEAWDNQMNFALSHVLGATIQTALFNAPLVVIVGWGLNKDMDFNFDMFTIIVLILAILVVGNFLRDQKSNYLEGALCVIVYCIIAVAAFYFPNNPAHGAGGSTEAAGAAESSSVAHRRF
ncbi:putative vacuolar cation/proton exchanger 2 [Amylocarpus encephaloides]|uniref:Vacuolar calcium ion transporter n=1 Tax=Amylocarpus encephaloides TaxID=45428 RepID=A0A9P7YKG9_9HELO|nr:putative vacuolar cation/proton exchanger 2 [Amylocarpus encephaloides]